MGQKRPLLKAGLIIIVVCFSFLFIEITKILALLEESYSGEKDIIVKKFLLCFVLVYLICGIIFTSLSFKNCSMTSPTFCQQSRCLITSFVLASLCGAVLIYFFLDGFMINIGVILGGLIVGCVFVLIEVYRNKKILDFYVNQMNEEDAYLHAECDTSKENIFNKE